MAVGWFGEGSAARGDAHEAMNLAGVRRLPMVFVCDNNQWAYSTPTHLGFATPRHRRPGRAYGFDGRRRRRHRRARRLPRGEARDREGPRRRRADADRVHDARAWRATPFTTTPSTSPRTCSRSGPKHDPIERFRSWLKENADLREQEEEELAVEVKKVLNEAIKRAEEAPLPDPETVADGVYAAPEDLDTPHHK